MKVTMRNKYDDTHEILSKVLEVQQMVTIIIPWTNIATLSQVHKNKCHSPHESCNIVSQTKRYILYHDPAYICIILLFKYMKQRFHEKVFITCNIL